jgi:hypothetical protein
MTGITKVAFEPVLKRINILLFPSPFSVHVDFFIRSQLHVTSHRFGIFIIFLENSVQSIDTNKLVIRLQAVHRREPIKVLVLYSHQVFDARLTPIN